MPTDPDIARTGTIVLACSGSGDQAKLSAMLAELGHWQVLQIEDPRQLGEADLLITDASRIRDWHQAIRAWRQQSSPRLCPVLVLAAQRHLALADGHLWQIADDLLNAPLHPRELMSRVAVALRARHLSRRLENLYVDRLEAAAERYRSLTSLASDGAYAAEVNGQEGTVRLQFDWVSEGLLALAGLGEESFRVGGGLKHWLSAEDARLLDLQYGAAANGRRTRELLQLRWPGGAETMEHIVLPRREPERRSMSVHAVLRIVSDQQQELDLQRQIARIAEQHDDGLMLSTVTGRVVYVNKAMEEIAGVALAGLLNGSVAGLAHALHAPELERMHVACGERSRSIRLEIAAGGPRAGRWLDVRVQPLLAANGRVDFLLCSLTDVSERHAQAERLDRMLTHDALTGLPGRALVQASLQAAVDWRQGDDAVVAVVLVSVSNLQAINEDGGHDAGDAVLRAVAQRLQSRRTEPATVGRMGGNEFALVLAVASSEGISQEVERLLAALERPVEVGEDCWPLSVHMGVAVAPDDGSAEGELLKKAESALNTCRANGGGHYLFFRPGMTTRAIERLRLEGDMRQAIASGELLLHFQPKVARIAGRPPSVEALLRCAHPTRGLLSPAEFIPVLESSGLIVQAGRQVVQMACELWQRMNAQGLDLHVAVNVSPRQLERGGFCEEVQAIVGQAGVPAASIEFEITESVVMHDAERMLSILTELREAGFRLAIDDFGTGFSSLAYLSRLPVDVLKIDRAFVAELPGEPRAVEMVKGIVSLAHAMGLETVAEGVETAEQAQFLAELGCDWQQGFYHARPLPEAQLAGYLHGLGQAS